MEDERPAYKSYEEMYQKEYHTVYSYIRRIISGNDAVVEDLTQEVFFVGGCWPTPSCWSFCRKMAGNAMRKTTFSWWIFIPR